MSGIPFPDLPKVLSYATRLSDLNIQNIPHLGYFLPKALLSALSILTNLSYLSLAFQSPRSCPSQTRRHLPLPTRTVLPNLTWLSFKGASEYLEDLVVLINAPRVSYLKAIFFNDIVFDTPQLAQFISRTPALMLPDMAHVCFRGDAARVALISRATDFKVIHIVLGILCTAPDWQFSFLEQICTSSLPSLSTLENLYILRDRFDLPVWKDNIENVLWLELLRPFTAVKNLYVFNSLTPRIGPALQELAGARTTEVLPALRVIFLDRSLSFRAAHEDIRQFVAMRQLISHPVAISRWLPNWPWLDYVATR